MLGGGEKVEPYEGTYYKGDIRPSIRNNKFYCNGHDCPAFGDLGDLESYEYGCILTQLEHGIMRTGVCLPAIERMREQYKSERDELRAKLEKIQGAKQQERLERQKAVIDPSRRCHHVFNNEDVECQKCSFIPGKPLF